MSSPTSDESTSKGGPSGALLLRTVALPADTNPQGAIFGGWIMSQLDIGGGILAHEAAGGRLVTVAADAMAFHKPVYVGDIVSCYGTCVKLGRTSLRIRLELWIKRMIERDPFFMEERVTEAIFTYVAVDDEGRPRPLPDSTHERLRSLAACED